jgi:hypothetical protein
MILLIDNYDSFVHNLARYVRELGAEAMVVRNDEITIEGVEALRTHAHRHFARAVLARRGRHFDRARSPPRADDADPWRVSRPPVHRRCLWRADPCGPAGRYTAARRSSATMRRACSPGLPSPIEVTRYHSLVIPPGAVPAPLRVTATANDDGEVMAVQHREHPVVGVQFHPESAATAVRIRDAGSLPPRRAFPSRGPAAAGGWRP